MGFSKPFIKIMLREHLRKENRVVVSTHSRYVPIAGDFTTDQSDDTSSRTSVWRQDVTPMFSVKENINSTLCLTSDWTEFGSQHAT